MNRRVILQTFETTLVEMDYEQTVTVAVAIFRFEGKVAIDLFYLQSGLSMEGEDIVGVAYAGPSHAESFPLQIVGWVPTIEDGIAWLQLNYMSGRRKTR